MSSLSLADGVANRDVTDLFRRVNEANSALMRGDARRYVALLPHARDYLLMSPFGGQPTDGFEPTEERLDALSRFFEGGHDARVRLLRSWVSEELIVLVTTEQQQVAVGGLPMQGWSLRVTLVFCRGASGWQLVHRHADPLMHGISLEQAAALGRGEASPIVARAA